MCTSVTYKRFMEDIMFDKIAYVVLRGQRQETIQVLGNKFANEFIEKVPDLDYPRTSWKYDPFQSYKRTSLDETRVNISL